MRELARWVVIVGVVTVLAGCTGGRTSPLRVTPEVLDEAGLQYYWKLPLILRSREAVTKLVRLDENVYCLTNRNRLIAVDASVGQMKWMYDVGDRGETVFSPIHADNVKLPEKVPGIRGILSSDTSNDLPPFDAVMINTLSYVLLLDRNTGKLYRKIPFEFAANSAGASDGVHFFAADTRGWYYAIRLRGTTKAWWLSADDAIRAPIKYHRGHIYVTDESGTAIATSIALGGQKKWTRNLRGAVTAEFHVDDRGCFIPSDDNRVYAFSLEGKKLWDPFTCEGPLQDAIQVGENTIFQYAQGDKFYAINLASGQKRWSRLDGRLVLGVFDGKVHLLNDDNTLTIVDEMLGTVETSLPMTGWQVFAGSTSGTAMYVASVDGEVACIREASAGYLTPEM